MTIWGAGGRDLSLHLPGTTTSTLHTETLDYIPSIYKTPVDENTVAYVNLAPRDPPRSSAASVHYGSAYIMGTRSLTEQKSNLTYRLDRNTEPADNMSWEPFSAAKNVSLSQHSITNGGTQHNGELSQSRHSLKNGIVLSQSQPTLPLQHPTGIPSTRL